MNEVKKITKKAGKTKKNKPTECSKSNQDKVTRLCLEKFMLMPYDERAREMDKYLNKLNLTEAEKEEVIRNPMTCVLLAEIYKSDNEMKHLKNKVKNAQIGASISAVIFNALTVALIGFILWFVYISFKTKRFRDKQHKKLAKKGMVVPYNYCFDDDDEPDYSKYGKHFPDYTKFGTRDEKPRCAMGMYKNVPYILAPIYFFNRNR